ncbi:hypothetical protein [Saccharospirillum sp.]|uniref:arsenate reductase/protein-tyrosine-phosphatase family protein n=1 Tax=Saccharospirillum sp. TaxID=2033801 RepID=UPI0034A0A762
MTMAGSLPVPNTWINDRFGSKKGLVRFSYYELRRLVGEYNPLMIDSDFQPARFVFVCVGNICRSPLAELVAKAHGIEAISYGLGTRGGDPADPRAIDFANNVGMDLTKHRTRRIEQYTHRSSDLIVGMEPRHLSPISKMHKEAKITLLGLYDNSSCAYIHDPFNTNSIFFYNCGKTVVEATTSLIRHVN